MAAKFVKLEQDNGRFGLSGELNFSNVAELWLNIEQAFSQMSTSLQHLSLDLADVQHSDSSGVALLVACLQLAHSQQRDLRFINMPAQMQSIAEVAELQAILTES